VVKEYREAGKPDHPVSGIQWKDAAAYCRYLGKSLPTSEQWEKALRGGLTLASSARNPHPARNLPWGTPRPDATAKLSGVEPAGTAPVGSFPDDISPEGVLDLAGNVSEWTVTAPNSDGPDRVIRGGNWTETDRESLVDFMAIRNVRIPTVTWFSIGFRCVTNRLPARP
jgi:formylglycine-generating enzyme required for sulfatase activity